MEALLASGGPELDVLVGQLSYGLDKTGSYISANRASTTFSNVNSASPDGVKLTTLNIGSANEWLDPSSVLLSFLVSETGTENKQLWPASPDPAILFSRLQIFLGSTQVEDIQDYNKLNDIMTKVSMSPSKKLDHFQLGFGVEPTVLATSYFHTDQHIPQKIAHSGNKRVFMKLNLSGLLSQHRYVPLFALGGQGLSIRLHLAPVPAAPVLRAGPGRF